MKFWTRCFIVFLHVALCQAYIQEESALPTITPASFLDDCDIDLCVIHFKTITGCSCWETQTCHDIPVEFLPKECDSCDNPAEVACSTLNDHSSGTPSMSPTNDHPSGTPSMSPTNNHPSGTPSMSPSSEMLRRELSGCGGKNSGCTQLLIGDGDCDSDSDCAGHLKCGKDNCKAFQPLSGTWPEDSEDGWDMTDDCCYDPSAACCSWDNWSSSCWSQPSSDNFMHACNNCTFAPCEDICADNPSSVSCWGCCASAEHEVDWQCHIEEDARRRKLAFTKELEDQNGGDEKSNPLAYILVAAGSCILLGFMALALRLYVNSSKAEAISSVHMQSENINSVSNLA